MATIRFPVVAHVRCDIDGRSRLLELPLWMLDRSTCAQMQLAEQPQVRFEHLRRLRELLLNVVSRRCCIGLPDVREVVAAQELGQHFGIDLVRLDLGLSNGLRLARIIHHCPTKMAS